MSWTDPWPMRGRSEAEPGPVRDRSGADPGSIWGRSWVDLEQIECRFWGPCGVDVRPWMQIPQGCPPCARAPAADPKAVVRDGDGAGTLAHELGLARQLRAALLQWSSVGGHARARTSGCWRFGPRLSRGWQALPLQAPARSGLPGQGPEDLGLCVCVGRGEARNRSCEARRGAAKARGAEPRRGDARGCTGQGKARRGEMRGEAPPKQGEARRGVANEGAAETRAGGGAKPRAGAPPAPASAAARAPAGAASGCPRTRSPSFGGLPNEP